MTLFFEEEQRFPEFLIPVVLIPTLTLNRTRPPEDILPADVFFLRLSSFFKMYALSLIYRHPCKNGV